jgi:hypothetical protein
MTIMPGFFVFALTSEHKVSHRMREVADETEHAMRTVEWADREARRQSLGKEEKSKMHDLYRQAIMDSNVRLVPKLGVHHSIANYIQNNPVKVLLGVGVPSVAYIFYGQYGQQQQLQMKLLHTRVFGQFAVLCTLLGVVGFKGVMDNMGKFVTEEEVDERVREMEATRERLLERLDYQASIQTVYKPKRKIVEQVE